MKTKKVSSKQKTPFQKQLPLQMFALAGMLYFFIFNVIPMVGIIMGFKDYQLSMGFKGIFTAKWVGLKYFKEFVSDYPHADQKHDRNQCFKTDIYISAADHLCGYAQ